MTVGRSEAADRFGYKLAASMTVDGRVRPDARLPQSRPSHFL